MLVRSLFIKYKMLVMYGIFGVLTTIINTVIYAFCYDIFHLANIPSNMIAWLLAVLFAFITNKIWVFKSVSKELDIIIKELMKFVGFRIVTGLLDLFIMYIGVDLMKGNSVKYKILSNIIVIICNYIASRLVIFRRINR